MCKLKFGLIIATFALVTSCERKEPSKIEKEAKLICINDSARRSQECALKEGPITTEDIDKRTAKYRKFEECNSKIAEAYKKCMQETVKKLQDSQGGKN